MNVCMNVEFLRMFVIRSCMFVSNTFNESGFIQSGMHFIDCWTVRGNRFKTFPLYTLSCQLMKIFDAFVRYIVELWINF